MTRSRRDLLLAMTAAGVLKAADSQLALQSLLTAPTFRGCIGASEVSALMRSENVSRDSLMLTLLPVARSRAHPPISNYFVGAVALGSSGSLYLGQNIEIPGNMLGLAVHAEQAAVANAYMSNESGIEAIAVTAAPCGHCRQFLSEASLDRSMRVLLPDAPPLVLADLLPRAFGPKDLGLTGGAFPVARFPARLRLPSQDQLIMAALTAACGAHAPYSRSPSGVALATTTERVFTGSYIENVAFNPSLPPLETALAGYFAAGPGAGGILRIALAEAESSSISHDLTTRSVAAAIAPSARVETRKFFIL